MTISIHIVNSAPDITLMADKPTNPAFKVIVTDDNGNKLKQKTVIYSVDNNDYNPKIDLEFYDSMKKEWQGSVKVLTDALGFATVTYRHGVINKKYGVLAQIDDGLETEQHRVQFNATVSLNVDNVKFLGSDVLTLNHTEASSVLHLTLTNGEGKAIPAITLTAEINSTVFTFANGELATPLTSDDKGVLTFTVLHGEATTGEGSIVFIIPGTAFRKMVPLKMK
jgi:hypothetical protein